MWTLPEGKLYNRVSVNYFAAREEWDAQGNLKAIQNNGKFTDTDIGNYLEYGISERLSFINSLFIKKIEKRDDFQVLSSYGVSDIEMGLKCRLMNGNLGVVSSQGLVKVPGPYDKNVALPLGNGQFDLELRLMYGVSLLRILPGYMNLEAGYRWRGEAPADEFRYLAEFGVDFTDRLYARVKLDAILSQKNGDRASDVNGNPILTNEFNAGKLDTTVGYKLSGGWMIEAEYIPVIYGGNTAKGTTVSLGVVYVTQ